MLEHPVDFSYLCEPAYLQYLRHNQEGKPEGPTEEELYDELNKNNTVIHGQNKKLIRMANKASEKVLEKIDRLAEELRNRESYWKGEAGKKDESDEEPDEIDDLDEPIAEGPGEAAAASTPIPLQMRRGYWDRSAAPPTPVELPTPVAPSAPSTPAVLSTPVAEQQSPVVPQTKELSVEQGNPARVRRMRSESPKSPFRELLLSPGTPLSAEQLQAVKQMKKVLNLKQTPAREAAVRAELHASPQDRLNLSPAREAAIDAALEKASAVRKSTRAAKKKLPYTPP